MAFILQMPQIPFCDYEEQERIVSEVSSRLSQCDSIEQTLENNTMTNGSIIIQTTSATDTLNIQINSTGAVTFNDPSGIEGYLVITQIA